MRASRFLRHRAQMNRTRYAMRGLVSEILPSLVVSMSRMNDTLRIQGEMLRRRSVHPNRCTCAISPNTGKRHYDDQCPVQENGGSDPEPQPGDGPDYHSEHAAWKARNHTDGSTT